MGGIISQFYPDEYLDSTYGIDFEAFYRKMSTFEEACIDEYVPLD